MKITIPAPQNKVRRLKFLLENPEHPKKTEVERLREEISWIRYGSKKVLEDYVLLSRTLVKNFKGSSTPK